MLLGIDLMMSIMTLFLKMRPFKIILAERIRCLMLISSLFWFFPFSLPLCFFLLFFVLFFFLFLMVPIYFSVHIGTHTTKGSAIKYQIQQLLSLFTSFPSSINNIYYSNITNCKYVMHWHKTIGHNNLQSNHHRHYKKRSQYKHLMLICCEW